MAKEGAPEKLIIDGKRLDGRDFETFRKFDLSVHVLKRSNGSGTFAFGNTRAIAGVQGPRELHPKFLQDPRNAVLRCRYMMAPFSTSDRIRPGHSRRGTEISKVTTDAFMSVLCPEDFPKTGIDVFIQILEADASTRCAGINAASLALADAAVPMKDLIASCSVGKVEGHIVTDLNGPEDMYGDVDFAVSMIGDTDKVVHLQMDGVITRDELSRMLIMAHKGCSEVYKNMKAALKAKYSSNVEGE